MALSRRKSPSRASPNNHKPDIGSLRRGRSSATALRERTAADVAFDLAMRRPRSNRSPRRAAGSVTAPPLPDRIAELLGRSKSSGQGTLGRRPEVGLSNFDVTPKPFRLSNHDVAILAGPPSARGGHSEATPVCGALTPRRPALDSDTTVGLLHHPALSGSGGRCGQRLRRAGLPIRRAGLPIPVDSAQPIPVASTKAMPSSTVPDQFAT